MNKPTLQIKNLTHSYLSPAKNVVPAVPPTLNDISLDLGSHRFLALLGPSGCGKTTLLRLLAGLERPTAGEIWIHNTCVVGPRNWVPAEKRGLAMVFQTYALWPHLTVEQNLRLPLKVKGGPYQQVENDAAVSRALESTRMESYRNRFPHELSGGQQQRVALARALAVEPQMILLDEPLSNLDTRLRVELKNEIKEIAHQSAATFVYVTHDQNEAFDLADLVAVMNQGHIEQLGTPDQILRTPQSEFVRSFTSPHS